VTGQRLKAQRVLEPVGDRATAHSSSDERDKLVLPFDQRQKSRLLTRLSSGRELLLTLPRGGILRNGALLELSDGSIAEVRAAPERVSCVQSDDMLSLCRAAYHLGNRHVSLQIEPGRLTYLHDHVLDDMLRGLGLEPSLAERPFEPESGAYGGEHSHAH
jgi:urease accessory protein